MMTQTTTKVTEFYHCSNCVARGSVQECARLLRCVFPIREAFVICGECKTGSECGLNRKCAKGETRDSHYFDTCLYCESEEQCVAAQQCRDKRDAELDAAKQDEKVDHPPHYGGDTPYEVIKVLEAWLTAEEYVGFLKGNVIKHNARARHKFAQQEDHAKAAWYQNKLVEFERKLRGDDD